MVILISFLTVISTLLGGLFALRFKLATGSLETTHKIQQHKRQIARVLTELREREIAAAEEEATN